MFPFDSTRFTRAALIVILGVVGTPWTVNLALKLKTGKLAEYRGYRDAWASSFVNLYLTSCRCICNPDGIIEMQRLTIDPQIKSAYTEYRDNTIGIMSI